MKIKWLIVIASIVALGAMTYSILQMGRSRCEICLEFQSRRHCSEALGPDNQAALEEAHRNACAILASGVTETLACQRTPAETSSCKAK